MTVFETEVMRLRNGVGPLSIHSLSAGPAAERMAASWPRVRRRVHGLVGVRPDCPEDRLEWIWSAVEYDVVEWARIASVPLPEAKALSTALRANRVVFPDGTINEWVDKYLRGKVAAMIKKSR